jgi:hypothetical protein
MSATDKKKIPEFYEKNAPRFDDNEPEELLPFLESVERMMELSGTPAGEKNAFVTRYLNHETRLQWEDFDSFRSAYKDFKKEILANYPSAVDTERGSLKKLKNILKKYDDADIGQSDQDELMQLARRMQKEANKLLVSSQITDAVAITLFLEKLEERFRELILENLERHPPALAAGVVQDPGTRTWTLKEVINEAKRMVQRHTVNSEFLDNDLPPFLVQPDVQ